MIEWKVKPYSSVKLFKKVNDTFDKLQSKFGKHLEYSVIKPIHPEFQFAQNGITAFIAGTGSGKSYNYLRMIANSETLFPDPVFETIVICATAAKFDQTVKVYKQTIKKAKLIPIKDEDLLEYINEYINKSHLYNTIMNFIINGMKYP